MHGQTSSKICDAGSQKQAAARQYLRICSAGDAAKLNLRRRWDVKPPTNRAQPFMWLSAVRLRSTMLRRDVGNSIAAESSKDVSVRETVSIVKPR